jgi:rubrerythrin
MAQYKCPICGFVVEFEGEMPADFVCPQCKCPGERFIKVEEEKADDGWATEHEVGIGSAEGVPADIVADLRSNFEGECTEVGMYLAMSRVAEREGYPEIGAYWKKAALEEAEHAAKFAELLGEVVSDSTQKNLEARVAAERGATAGKADLAARADKAGLGAIRDTVYEMARDEARHGKALEGLLKRYFG